MHNKECKYNLKFSRILPSLKKYDWKNKIQICCYMIKIDLVNYEDT